MYPLKRCTSALEPQHICVRWSCFVGLHVQAAQAQAVAAADTRHPGSANPRVCGYTSTNALPGTPYHGRQACHVRDVMVQVTGQFLVQS